MLVINCFDLIMRNLYPTIAMSLKIEMMVSRNQVRRRPSLEEIEGGLQVLSTSKFLGLLHYTYLPPQQGALHISREILEEIT
jgi:hypothetical protein